MTYLMFTISVIGNALFALIVGATGYFLIRSSKDGYWGKNGEDIKYQIFEDDQERSSHG
jgi:hypothetical protein